MRENHINFFTYLVFLSLRQMDTKMRRIADRNGNP